MIKPTVGRIVHYHPTFSDQERGMNFTDTQPVAAMVACVWSDTCVNLTVFDANGYAHSRTSVLLHQEGNTKPGRGYAEWMPYQTGQAAKTEKLQAQLDAKS